MTLLFFKNYSISLLMATLTLTLAGYSTQSWAAYEYVTQFGSFGTSTGEFNAPRGVTVDQQGVIIITDAGNNRVQLCDDTGSCTAFGGPGIASGEFDKPREVTVNSVDRIFIADRGNDRIQSCNDSGSCDDFDGIGSGVGSFESPRGVAVDSAGQIYISDTDNDRVQICDDQGLVCTGFGSTGSAVGQFISPAGIAVDSQGRVIIADRGNNRIQVCSTEGSCTAFGGPGTGLGQFDGPAGITVDSQDRIIIVDRFNHRIQVCTNDGSSCSAFGSIGSSNGQFFEPWGVGVDSTDRIIVADKGNDRIQIFAETSAPAVQITSFTVSPSTIEEGESTTLSWSVSNATSCTATNGTSAWRALTPNASSGTANITINTADSYTFTLNCTNGVTNDSANAGVTVTALPPPVSIDSFTASPSTIQEGESTTLIWAVSNATTCTALGGTSGWQALSPNAVSGNAAVSIATADSYTFTLECTDGITLDSANVDVIVTETPPPVSIDSFSASPSTFQEGDSTTLSWTVSHATSCSALNGTGDWRALTPNAASGTANITIATAGSYTFTLECTDGVTTDSTDVGVTVTETPPPVIIDSFTASPSTFQEGESTTLSWAVSHATSCSALGGTSDWRALTPNATNGTANITVATVGSYTFTLECTDGVTTDSVDVGVTVTETPPPVIIDSFTASPSTIQEGESTTLSWVISNATSCTALAGTENWRALTPNAISGTAGISIAVAGSYSFTLECTDGLTTDSADVGVEVSETPPPVSIEAFTAAPANIREGESTTLSWTVSHATSCTALNGTGDWRALTPNTTSGTVNITIATPGSYSFTLECTDGSNTTSANTGVTVSGTPSLIEMNAGLNDAWFYPVTDGQGFFITVFPDLGLVTLAWFTYDTERPDAEVIANLGEPGHRWLTALGTFSGNRAVMDIDIASGGIFDTQTDIQHTDPTGSDGTIILTFSDCENGLVEYDIPSIGQRGEVPLQRIVPDNVALCEVLAEQAEVQQSNSVKMTDKSNVLSVDVPVTMADAPPLTDMNAGLNDAWFYPVTDGQGFFITVFPDLGLVTLAWFTYDTERPDAEVTANLGEPGHRWLTALGTFSGNRAVMDIDIASGGIFDTQTDIQHTDPTGSDGTIILTFSDCENGLVEYTIPSIGQSGEVPLQRIVPDNVALCEALAE